MLQNQTKSVVLYVFKRQKITKIDLFKNISGDIGYKIVCQKWT